MNTNQTIDGVPRELRALLERVVGKASQTPHWDALDEDRIAATAELRALLDAPAKDPCTQAIQHLERFKDVARSGDVGGIIEMGAELIGMAYFDNQEAAENVESTDTALHGGDGLSTSDGDCVREHSVAAQPQGEPVAIVVEQTHNYANYLVFGSSIPGVQQPVPVVKRKAHLLDQSLPTGTKLYAEKPAPVSVVLPERNVVRVYKPIRIDGTELAQVWNACLDEVTRLNTNRPTHANPPPGTEPSGAHHDNDGLDEWRKP